MNNKRARFLIIFLLRKRSRTKYTFIQTYAYVKHRYIETGMA
jgi:hypothetical protein